MTRRKLRSGPFADASAPAPAGPRRSPGQAHDRHRRSAPDGLWLYGRHAVMAGIANAKRPLSRILATAETLADLARAVAAAPVPRPAPIPVDRREIAAMLPPDAVHQGFAALARALDPADLDDVPGVAAGDALVVILDQVTDPRNVGAVLRSAQAFGAAAVVVQDRHAPAETGALAKAASGALEAVPLVREVNLARALRALRERGFHCVGLDGGASEPLSRTALRGPTVLVLGAEGEGLRRLVREACDRLVRIPIAAGVDSLNLSAAAAIALHECARARAQAHAHAGDPAGAREADERGDGEDVAS